MTRLLRIWLAKPVVWLAELLIAGAKAILPKEHREPGRRVHSRRLF
jgi:hypothetical protein